MKYIFFSFLVLGLTSCSLSNPLRENPSKNAVPAISVGEVQISDSGASVSSGSVSVDVDSGVLVGSESGNISANEDGVNVVSRDNTGTIRKNGVSVGTGTKIPAPKTGDIEKDPEIQDITKDIDAIFSDIEKGGK
ncbi:MAG: hypothetical protein PHH16_02685 [Candidatus Gracilibacteria bacterium]|nr:hypothetical protein [Candidatus Gracilibacteria bacterium]